MEPTIQPNQTDLEKEEERQGPDLAGLPQERNIWRMPDFPPSPRSVPTKFEINSEPELIQCNFLIVETLSSGRHRNISVPVQRLVQRSQGRGIGNFSKPFAAGMNSCLHIKSFLGQGKTIELLGGLSPLSCKENVKKVTNLLKNQSHLSMDQKKDLEMIPALEKKEPVASASSKKAPEKYKEKPQGPQQKRRGPKNNQGTGKGKGNRHRPYPQGCRIPKLEPSDADIVFNMARTLMEFTANKQERMSRNFPHI
ncbi:hypothetical protein O181_023995 [Austropuccinia psidii MF-1]|uniref:Uncharacterized protein n=1 Tax=Austropuccinia psidii MF-1 TaxID=1389203 RepID=A0A9Q3CJP2_9BASI|nr:hypothetical protein [Austropuccinia psidii MF-1]